MISAYSSLLIAGLCVGVNSKPDVEIEFYRKIHCSLSTSSLSHSLSVVAVGLTLFFSSPSLSLFHDPTMAAKLLNLIALSSLAILACSWGPTQTNALSVDSPHNIAARHHNVIAKKKRGTTARRCKPRPVSSSLSPAATTTPAPAPAPTTTPKANPATSTTASGGSGTPSNTGGYNGPPGKVGLAYAGPDDGTINHFITPKVTAYALLFSFIHPMLIYILEFTTGVPGPQLLPLLLDLNSCQCFGDPSKSVISPNSSSQATPRLFWVLTSMLVILQIVLFFLTISFFRPNQPGQSDLDPGYAAQLWQQYIQPLKNQGYALVTPACTNAPSGKQWMQTFFSACSGCTVSSLTLCLVSLLANDCFPSTMLSLFTIMVLRPMISSTTLPTITPLSALISSSPSLLARFVALATSSEDFFDKN